MIPLLPITSDPIREVGPQIQVAYPGAGDLALIAAICVVSVLLSLLWLIGVWQYIGTREQRSGNAVPEHTTR